MAYNVNFITGLPVKLPGVPAGKRKEIAPLLNGKGHLINYRHHSVIMNKKRKLAFFSASNINGNDWKLLNRKGGFRKDKKIADSYQLGNNCTMSLKVQPGGPMIFNRAILHRSRK